MKPFKAIAAGLMVVGLAGCAAHHRQEKGGFYTKTGEPTPARVIVQKLQFAISEVNLTLAGIPAGAPSFNDGKRIDGRIGGCAIMHVSPAIIGTASHYPVVLTLNSDQCSDRTRAAIYRYENGARLGVSAQSAITIKNGDARIEFMKNGRIVG